MLVWSSIFSWLLVFSWALGYSGWGNTSILWVWPYSIVHFLVVLVLRFSIYFSLVFQLYISCYILWTRFRYSFRNVVLLSALPTCVMGIPPLYCIGNNTMQFSRHFCGVAWVENNQIVHILAAREKWAANGAEHTWLIHLGFEWRGHGGPRVWVKVSDFFGFDICCSPAHLLFRMGSLVSQLQTVAEI